MALLILSTLLIGAALGARFKVLVLIPAIALVFTTTIATGIAHGDGVSAIAIAAAVASCSLQVGYVVGLVSQRRVIATRRAPLHAKPAR